MHSPAPSAPAAIRGNRSSHAGIALLPLNPAAEHTHPLRVAA
ncbi:hypothetical protein [Streptomyces sp. P3]|nr:hypothetical protein [Streptomyces sp. P3]